MSFGGVVPKFWYVERRDRCCGRQLTAGCSRGKPPAPNILQPVGTDAAQAVMRKQMAALSPRTSPTARQRNTLTSRGAALEGPTHEHHRCEGAAALSARSGAGSGANSMTPRVRQRALAQPRAASQTRRATRADKHEMAAQPSAPQQAKFSAL